MAWFKIVLFLFGISSYNVQMIDAADCSITGVNVSSNPSSDSVIVGSTVVYTITCAATVMCPDMNDNDTLTLSIIYDGPITMGSNQQVVEFDDMTTNYTHSVNLNTPIQIQHAGVYMCNASLQDNGTFLLSDSNDFNVTLPTPNVTAGGSSVIQLQTDATVQCNVSLQDLSNVTLTDTFVTVMWLPSNELPSKTFSAATTISDTRTINSSLSNAGEYACIAELFFNGSNSPYVTDTSDQSTATVIITIQTPTVTVESVIVAIGSVAVLNCSKVDVPEPSLVNTNITWTPNNGMANGTQYTINNVTSTDTGMYTCTATITAKPNITNVMQAIGSDTGTVYGTELSTTSSATIRLDVFPYNNFITQCNLTYYPSSPAINVTFSYTDNNTNGDSVSDTTVSMDNPMINTQSVNITNANESSLTQYEYTCTVTVSANDAPVDFTDSESNSITVRGPTKPVIPELLDPITNSNLATINWRVPSVSYTPETYIVRYGVSADNLNYSMSGGVSQGIENKSFLTDQNVMYSVDINGLTSGVMYFYQLNSSNSFDSVSVNGSFTTAEAAPSEPTNVMIVTPTNTSLTLQWSKPSMTNGNITMYNYYCMATNNSRNTSSITNSVPPSMLLSVIVMGLLPYTEYECIVTASTNAGASTPGITTGVTGQGVPTGPPTNFIVTADNTNPQMLILSWSLPDKDNRNGIIIQYYYNCVNDSNERGGITQETTATISGLLVFTQYTCTVTAATVIGIGDTLAMFTTTTGEDAPTAVRDLTFTRGVTETVFDISWTVPETLNGIISRYNITVVDYTNNQFVLYQMAPNLSANVDSNDFRMGTPYIVYVSAVTGGGQGPSISVTNFTQQGTPSEVQGVTANRINSTAMNVTWRPLTIIEAQGFITEYTVTLTPTTISKKRQAVQPIIMMFNSDTSGGIITGLTGSTTYSVTVNVSNGDMEGPTSPAIIIIPLPVDDSNDAVVIGIVVAFGAAVLIIIIIVIIVLIILYVRIGQSNESLIHENPSALDERRQNENGNELKLLSVKVDKEEFSERMQPIPMEDFADHVRQLHLNRDLGFEEEYESIKRIPPGSYVVAKMQSNIAKNRFDNVYSYDDSRVILPITEGCTDYINASFIDGYKRPKAFIAAQGPLPNTVVDFWRMVWEFQLPTVVMLTELIERGIEKCTCYYPRCNNETMDVGNGLKVTLIEQQQFVEYKYKKFLLLNTKDDGGRLDVTHYHFLAWPDHGVPADKTVMMAFAKRVRQTHPPEGPPVIVHCSAGVGRTGTFIVLDSMMQRIERKETSLNIYELVADMRHKRTLMVQTMAQYIYTHDALSEYIISGDTSITTKGIRDRMNELSKVSGGESGYQKQLDLLNEISRLPSEGHCSDSLSKQNVVKNRYSQVITSLPYNETRVRLRTTSGVGDYINASVVDGYKHKGAFLAAQSPLETTAGDLWRMVWEHWSASIVMLCSTDEEESMYCYWPSEVDKKSVYGMIEVRLVSEKEEKDFMVRKFELSQESNYVNLATGNADKLMVTQYHYNKWPATGKPTKCDSLLEMLNQLLKTQKLSGNKAISVMCNDGINRSGAFICLYSQLERVKVEGICDVFQFIKSSRFHRPGLVQSVDNYIFCHEVLLEFLNSFDQYENFK